MHRQVGPLVLEESGVALRGLLLRHLVMPGEVGGTREIMHWIANELGPDTYVNLMPQYYPAGKVSDKEHAEINRGITLAEFQEALEAASEAGLRHLDNRFVLHAVMH
jgi:putative pyruvate formate lyase activating enzyme